MCCIPVLLESVENGVCCHLNTPPAHLVQTIRLRHFISSNVIGQGFINLLRDDLNQPNIIRRPTPIELFL